MNQFLSAFHYFVQREEEPNPLNKTALFTALFVCLRLTYGLSNEYFTFKRIIGKRSSKKREKENKKEWINDLSSNTFGPDSTTEVNKIQPPHFWNISVFNYKSRCRSECAVNVTFSFLHKWGSGSKTAQPSWSQRQCVLQLRARQHWEVFACDHPRPSVPQLRLPSERSTDALA